MTHTGKIVSKVESEYMIGKEHPSYGETFKEEDHIVQGEVCAYYSGVGEG